MISFFLLFTLRSITITRTLLLGLLGIVFGLAVIVITGIPLIITDILVGKGTGIAGIAASSTAGAAVATPLLVADMVPEFAPAATALVATALIVTSIVVPIITGLYAKNAKRFSSLNRNEDKGKMAV
jgi:2-keto-3-deoxygluconate permease